MLRERPLLIPFLALAAGLCAADYYDTLLPLSSAIALLACLFLSCFVRSRIPLTICTFAFFFVWGMYALTPWKSPVYPTISIQQYTSRSPVIVEGVIGERPVATASASSFILRTDAVIRAGQVLPVSGNLLIYISNGDISLGRGDRIRLATRINLAHRLGLPGEFDYPRYLAYHEIGATGRVNSQEDIVLMRGAHEDSPARWIDLTARKLGDFIRASLPDNQVSSVLTALLVGDQKRIPQELADAYTRAGVNHILSISGFHVGIIAFFIVQVTLLLASRSEALALGCNLRRSVLLLALPAMLLYLYLTGAAPATSRSVIMLAVFVLALYAERETDPLNALLLSAMLLVALNPPSLFDISFQLSFLALWGIVIAVPPAMKRFGDLQPGWLRTLLQFIITSCAASAATAIPVLFSFNQASLNGIVSNFLIVPLLGYGAVLAGFCALPLIPVFAPAAQLLLWLAGKLVLFSNLLVQLFAKLPLLRFHGITHLDMLLFLACMSSFSFLRPSRLRLALCAALPAVAVMGHLLAPSAANGRLRIIMLSMGQAESLLIRLPDGGSMLVDGGGYLHDNGRDFGERYLAPALHKLGVERIDRMVMTHSHPDHIGGLSYIVRTMPVGEFWEPASGGCGDQYQQLRSIMNERHVPRRVLAAGDSFSLARGVEMKVLSPLRNVSHGTEQLSDDMGLNEDSLVFRIRFGSFSMLFTADAGFPAEELMIAGTAELASTILKVGHHGSRYSTSDRFLKQVAPQAALISAGQGNAFGLPSDDTLHQLRQSGVRVYRTDQDGSIELTSDGKGWNINTPYRSK